MNKRQKKRPKRNKRRPYLRLSTTMDDTNTNKSSTSTITAKIASSKFRLARIEMSRSMEFLQSQIERGTHISSLKTLAQKTEDRLEQMKVIATEVFANGSSEDNDDAMEICACLSRQLLELTHNVNTLRLNQLFWF